MTLSHGSSLPHPGPFSRESVAFPALRVPPTARGQRIGLFGGSFNPPHKGHRHVAQAALNRLGLDRIWWMVTPGNPLKSVADLPPLRRRVELTRQFADHPRMTVTAFEAAIGTRYSAEVIGYLKRHRPDVRFVWVMGADNLASLHRWQDWEDIMSRMPVAVVNRPGASLSALNAPAARAFSRYRRPESEARGLADLVPPAWTFLHVPLEATSSTALRTETASEGMP